MKFIISKSEVLKEGRAGTNGRPETKWSQGEACWIRN